MRRKLMLINAGLLLVVIAVGSTVRKEWRTYRRANNAAGIKAGTTDRTSGSAAALAPEAALPQAGSYDLIFERNLFSPNRTEFEPAEPVAESPAVAPMPGMPLLTGVTVIGNRKLAFIQEPRSGAQPQNRTVQVGDSIMNFGKITEIRPDALVFTWGGATHVVEMLNSDASKARGPVAARLQTTVITVGAGKKGAPAPPAAGAPPAGTVPVVGGGGGPTIQISSVGPGKAVAASAGRTGTPARGGTAGARSVTGGAGATQTQPQNQGFIDTPFGRVMRPPPRTN